MSKFTHGIKATELPRTFQDAILLCYEFGITYLWIDSLCIIQGDGSDWQHEAKRTDSIYGNAFLVVSATVSASDEDGFLNMRESHYSRSVRHDLDEKNLDLRIEPMKVHYDHHFNAGPLSRRGWAFQERVLGRRVISYHHDELHWECCEGWRCECGVGDKLASPTHPYNFLARLESPSNNSYAIWHHSLNLYTGRILTMPSDKLPAISGIANILQATNHDTYYAGLWGGNIIQDLAWFNVDNLYSCKLPDKYRAPTWSWAGKDCGALYRDYTELRKYAEVINIQCKTLDESQVSQVTSGWLLISGQLTEAWVTMPTGTTSEQPLFVGAKSLDYVHYFFTDNSLSIVLDSAHKALITPSNVFTGVYEASDNPSEKPHQRQATDGRVWCLKLMEGSGDVEMDISDSDFVSHDDIIMVLSRSSNELDASYIRIGLALVPHSQSMEMLFSEAPTTTIKIV